MRPKLESQDGISAAQMVESGTSKAPATALTARGSDRPERVDMTDSTPCKDCLGTGISAMFGYRCHTCDGTGAKHQPKFRAACECGAKQPRATTPYTANRWMLNHLATSHRYLGGGA